MRQRLLEPQVSPLKGPGMDLPGLTHSELRHWGSSLKGTRDIWGGIGLFGFGMTATGAAFSQTEELAEAIVL